MRQAMWMGLVGVITAWPASGWACGDNDEPQYDLRGFYPADGAVDVPRNAALRFDIDCALPGASAKLEQQSCAGGAGGLQVVLTLEGTDTKVGGTLVQHGTQRLFVPTGPLPANTAFHVEATLPFYDPDAEGPGVRAASFGFRTGETVLAEPRSADDTAARFETYEGASALCAELGRVVGQEAEKYAAGVCLGPECTIDGTASVPRLTVEASAPSGPLDELGYVLRFEGWRRDDLHVYEERHVAAGEQVTFQRDLPPTSWIEPATDACARVTASDGAGRMLVLHDACFDLAATRASLESVDEGRDLEVDVDGPGEGGCNLTHGSHGSLSMIGLLSVVVGRRRRKSA